MQKDEWTRFGVHKLFLASSGKPLTAITKAVLEELGLMSLLNHSQLRRFLRKLEKLYRKNEYHSSTHAADVVHAVYVIIKQVWLCKCDSVGCAHAAAAAAVQAQLFNAASCGNNPSQDSCALRPVAIFSAAGHMNAHEVNRGLPLNRIQLAASTARMAPEYVLLSRI